MVVVLTSYNERNLYTYIKFILGRRFLQTCWFGITSIDNSVNLYTSRNVKVQAMLSLQQQGTNNI